MQEIIIKSRIKPRKVPENIISRERLTELLEKNSTKNLILLISPAGFGKTTLVLDYLNIKKKNYAWLHASEDISSIYNFIIYIVYALKNIKQDFGENTLLIINSLKNSGVKNVTGDIKDITATFINEFISFFEDEIFLVIDDLHNISEGEWLSQFFDNLTFNYPENLHLIITTRVIPAFSTAKLEAKRNVLIITEQELEFNADEINRVVEEIYFSKINEGQRIFLETKLKGWITGIHLAIQAPEGKLDSMDYGEHKAKENIFAYFANDIFETLENKIKDFLLKTSLLNEFTIAGCIKLFGFIEADTIIRDLLSKNIFIEKKYIKESDETIYIYHSLFRDYLRNKFYNTYGETERSSFLTTLSEKLLDEKEFEQAIEFLLELENYDKCIEVIRNIKTDYLNQGRDDILWKWIERLPDTLINNDIELIFLKGFLLKRYKGEYEAASVYLKRCAEFPGKSDVSLKANLEYVNLLLVWLRINEAIDLLEKLLTGEIDNTNRAKILFILSDAYHRIGYDVDSKVLPSANEALEIANEENLQDLKTNIYDMIGRAYQARGMFVKSTYYYELALKNTTLIYHKLRILSNTIVLNCDMGKFEKAHELMKAMDELVRHFPAPKLKFERLRMDAVFSYDSGDFEKAREYCEEIIIQSREKNLLLYVFWHYLQIGESYFLQNNPEKAKIYFELASKYINKSDEASVLEFNARNLLLEDVNKEGLENKYLYTVTRLEELGYTQELAGHLFYISNYYYLTKQYASSLEFLKRSLNISNKYQYISTIEMRFTRFRYLYDFAISNNVETVFIRSIILSLIERVNASYISSEHKNRLEENIHTFYDIDLKVFGGAEIFIRGNQVREEQWIRKKSKLILVYLLLNPEFKFTKDKIMDMFFPESSPETADNIFHQVISNIRNIIKIPGPEEKKVKKKDEVILQNSPFVIYEDKILRLNENYFYRVDSKDFDKFYNIYRSSESITEEKLRAADEALKLYKGELLSGVYETWCEDLREVYHNKFIALCEFLSENYKKRKMYFEALELSERLIKEDKLNEKGYLTIIECHAELGNLNIAKSKYEQLIKAFEEEYGEKPDRKIIEKVEAVFKTNNI
jgi:LuxR family transcriptional regulator, maltose regulon positive regulatory protein